MRSGKSLTSSFGGASQVMWPETVLRYVYLEEYGSSKMVSWVQKGQLALLDVKRILQIAQWNISNAEKMLEAMIKEGMTRTQKKNFAEYMNCLLYTSPSPRDRTRSRMPSSA